MRYWATCTKYHVKPRIAIFLNHPECSAQCAVGMYEALSSDFTVDMFHTDQIKNNIFKKADIVAFPGGIGDSDTFFKYLAPKADYIREAVYYGKRYLGICMGAYWAGSMFLDILKGRDCVQYLRRPKTDTHRPHAKDLEITWLGNKEKMFWYDGCSITGKGKFDVVATYPNGDAMAIMQNRIGLIGCHPEAEQHWYDDYTWMRKRWNSSKEYLLLDFVNKLMER